MTIGALGFTTTTAVLNTEMSDIASGKSKGFMPSPVTHTHCLNECPSNIATRGAGRFMGFLGY